LAPGIGLCEMVRVPSISMANPKECLMTLKGLFKVELAVLVRLDS